MTILASDTFNRANGGLGANWTTTTSESAPSIVSNEVSNNSTASVGARYTGIAWPNDQYASVTVGSTLATVTDNGVGPACRIASGAQTHYLAQTNTVETRLYKVVAGTFTQLGADGVACTTGDVLKLICSGSSISVAKNGTTIIGPVTDASISAGDAGIWMSDTGASCTLDNFEGGDLAAGGSTDQIWSETGDWYEGSSLAEIDGSDLGPWGWYADDATPSRLNADPISLPALPESFEWEDVNTDEVFYQWPWAQGPPPADVDTQVYPWTIEDASLQPVDFIDEDFAAFDVPLAADVVAAPYQINVEDGSAQPVDFLDEDFAFADVPLAADVAPDQITPEDGSAQPVEALDENFAFADAPLAADNDVVAPRDDAANQPEDADEDFGFADTPQDVPVVATDIIDAYFALPEDAEDEPQSFTTDPLPDDIFDQLFNEFGGFEDLEEDGDDFTDVPLPADVSSAPDQIGADDASAQLEEAEEDFGFTAAPLADDNDVAASRAYDASEQQEEDEFLESGADAPLAADAAQQVDQIVIDDASSQLEDADEDFGFSADPLPEDAPMLALVEDGNTREEDTGDEDFGTQNSDPLPDDVQSDQVFTLFPDQAEEPEDEPFGFSTDPTVPELVIEEPLPVCDFPLQSEEPPDEDFGFSDLQTPADVAQPPDQPSVTGGWPIYYGKKRRVEREQQRLDALEEEQQAIERQIAKARSEKAKLKERERLAKNQQRQVDQEALLVILIAELEKEYAALQQNDDDVIAFLLLNM